MHWAYCRVIFSWEYVIVIDDTSHSIDKSFFWWQGDACLYLSLKAMHHEWLSTIYPPDYCLVQLKKWTRKTFEIRNSDKLCDKITNPKNSALRPCNVACWVSSCLSEKNPRTVYYNLLIIPIQGLQFSPGLLLLATFMPYFDVKVRWVIHKPLFTVLLIGLTVPL